MSQSMLDLRAAIHAALMADATLVAMLGGPRLHDEPPRAAKGLYAVFAAASADDGSGVEAPLVAHRLEIDVWGPHSGGTARALEAASRIVTLLDDATPALASGHVVALRWRGTDARRDDKTGLPRVTLRFAATTEPA
jgi:hypothetical protein